MTIGDIAQLITALAAVGALLVSIHNSRKIRQVHAATNGLSHELNVLTAKASKAEGVKEEKERHKAMSLLDDIVSAIYRFVGGEVPRAELEAKLDAQAKAHPEKLDWRHSIVDLLKMTGQDSSREARDRLAAELKYEGHYNGGAAQNLWLHGKVMEKLARSP